MQVLSCAKDEEIDQLDEYLEKVSLSIEEATSYYPFDIDVYVKKDEEKAQVRIINAHTNVVLIKKNDDIKLKKEITKSRQCVN